MKKRLSLVKFIKEAKMIDDGFSEKEARLLAKKLNLDLDKERFSFADWVDGTNHEIEHEQTVNGSPSTIAKIALDHLKEDPDYYKKLAKIES
jgi:hypothetical protein